MTNKGTETGRDREMETGIGTGDKRQLGTVTGDMQRQGTWI